MKELNLLNHLIENVIKITTKCYDDVLNEEYENIENDFETRGKMLDIIMTIQENLSSAPTTKNSNIIVQYNNQLNQLVERVKAFDAQILENLQKEQSKTQIQIAKAFKNKENFKGYNLNNIK